MRFGWLAAAAAVVCAVPAGAANYLELQVTGDFVARPPNNYPQHYIDTQTIYFDLANIPSPYAVGPVGSTTGSIFLDTIKSPTLNLISSATPTGANYGLKFVLTGLSEDFQSLAISNPSFNYTFSIGRDAYVSSVGQVDSFMGRIVTDAPTIGFSDILTAVPEPATWSMMLFGFGALGVALRRKRRDYAASPAFQPR